ncbi:MOP flippase family protein [Photorhabdus sp. APURE]|uniref:MOP flippase family protein n=1 Tax=Photorhabdus aballayi TaxID=2991723 RepID=UPI00223DB489|nr:MOP flippase family protein [Photorhabdus aballayi]MCW7548261.1 MOP flippase family protein [Photorhabdus aballayi]
MKKAIGWTMLANFNAIGLQLFQISILARVLSPSDFGIIAISNAICMLIITLQDMGLSGYVVHKQKINKQELSSLYWFSIFVGIILFVLLFTLSRYISEYYVLPDLKNVLIVLSFNFIIIAANSQVQAICLKEYQFDYIAKVDFLAKWIGFITSIISAYKGFGAISIANGLLIGNMSKTFFFIIQRWKYRPDFFFNSSYIWPAASYSIYQLAGQVINTISLHIDNLIMGKMVPTSSLGFYSLSKDLSIKASMMINPVVNKMALPVFSKAQHNLSRCSRIYMANLRLISTINALGYAIMMAFSSHIIKVLYSEEYIICAEYLKFLALFGFLRCCINPIGSLLQATGNTKYEFQWNIINFIISVGLVAGAVFFGIDAVIFANILSQFTLVILVYFFVLRRVLPLSFPAYLLSLAPGVIFCSVIFIFTRIFLEPDNKDIIMSLYFFFLISIFIFYIIWLIKDILLIREQLK